jgi:hypothetical protein
VTLTTNLRSCYLFGATVTTDNEGNYNLTNSGVTSDSTTVKVEATSARFDGTDNMQQAAAATNGLNAFTISMWVKRDGTAVQYNLWGKNGAVDRAQYGVAGASDAYIQVGSSQQFTGNTGVTMTNWHHLIFASDGTDMYLVLNGVVRAKKANTANLSAAGNMFFGHNSVNTNERLAGYMSQLALWSDIISGISGTALNGSVTGDAASLYNSGSGLARASWAAVPGTNMQINVGDVWKVVAGAQINIGDTWKTVSSVKVNVGDTWKVVF